MVKKSVEYYIKKSNDVFNGKYDYSLIKEIKNANEKVPVICPEHGVFYVSFRKHISRKQECPICTKERRTKEGYFRWTIEDRCNRFIQKSIIEHNGKYDYSLVKEYYKDGETKVPIICPEHGIFWQIPHSHLRGYGCQKCATNVRAKKKMHTTEWFIQKSKDMHGDDTFDYSQTVYMGSDEDIYLICHEKDEFGNEHGIFKTTPSRHLSKSNHCGCPKCNGGVRLTQEEFIRKINKIFDNKYDTSLVNYVNSTTEVTLICPIHGEFRRKAGFFTMGYGCPKCQYSIIENKTDNILRDNNIEYIYEYSPEFMKSCKFGHQSLDFYLPQFNVAIECQGKQHFMPISIFGGEEGFDKIMKRDLMKFDKCKDNDIKIYYLVDKKTFSSIKNLELPYIYANNLYTNMNDILNIILAK